MTPQRIDGATMLPSVSLPIAKPTSAAAVGGAGAGARARRAFVEQPRVHRLAAEPDVVERERAEAELGDEHGAGVVEARAPPPSRSPARDVRNGSAPHVVGMSVVSSRSFTP